MAGGQGGANGSLRPGILKLDAVPRGAARFHSKIYFVSKFHVTHSSVFCMFAMELAHFVSTSKINTGENALCCKGKII